MLSCAVVMAASVRLLAAPADPLDAFKVVWDSPNGDHHGSMPLGNRELVMRASQAVETWWRCTNAVPELAGCISVTERFHAGPLVPSLSGSWASSFVAANGFPACVLST